MSVAAWRADRSHERQCCPGCKLGSRCRPARWLHQFACLCGPGVAQSRSPLCLTNRTIASASDNFSSARATERLPLRVARSELYKSVPKKFEIRLTRYSWELPCPSPVHGTYLPPLFPGSLSLYPPQTIISVPVHTAV